MQDCDIEESEFELQSRSYIYFLSNNPLERYEKPYPPLPRPICLVGRVFAIAQGDRGSIQGRVIPKTQKVVLGASLLNTQHYMVRIKGKVE